MELLIKRLAEILQKIAGPGTAVAQVVGQLGGQLQRFGLINSDQLLRNLVLDQIDVVGHPEHLRTIQFLVLLHQ